MTAYIEYVFLENFLLDGLLLFGACRLTKTRVRYLALALSCVCGGVYALLSPFIRLPIPLDILLKFSVGACLCLLAFGRIKNRKEWGRYAFFCSAFFLFTFAVGGFLTAVWSRFPKKIPFIFVLLAIAVLLFALETFFGGMRRKQKAFAYIRNCIIQTGEKQVTARGYLDSGNLAVVNGLPVCF
ncbi:MAG: sigma-E processing peptidase SpoIIGA, partial [Clostridia bacterium]|nr:sigma-E processing peptidase SpoIIGA [Clostridia bacterium]